MPMITYVLTAIGDDRPGLVSALSAVVADHDGNWVDSSLALLGGKFAGIVVVELDESRAPAFVDGLGTLAAQEGLEVNATVAGVAAEAGSRDEAAGAAGAGTGSSWRLHLLGQDRRGMVHEVTSALASAGATIDELRTWTRAAPQGGGLLFEAEASLRLASEAEADTVQAVLERIASELMVDLDLEAEGSD